MNDPQFFWPLGYDVDTTVATSSCPYDRYEDTPQLQQKTVAQNSVIFAKGLWLRISCGNNC